MFYRHKIRVRENFIGIDCLREKVFFSRKKYQSLIFAWKMGFKYLIYKKIIKMRLLGFWAEKSHWSLIEFFNPISPVDVLWLCQYNQDKSRWCVYFFSSSVGLFMPSGWSACARYTGIRSPPRGHRQTVCWAAIAHSVGNECPNIGLVFG